MPANYVLLERIELNASAASVTFSNIPQSGYTDLKLVMSTRAADSANNWYATKIQFNTDTTASNYPYRVLYGFGSTVGSGTGNQYAGYIPSNARTANTFGNNEIYIPNYLSTTAKSFSTDTVTEGNGSSYEILGFWAGQWSGTAAINQIVLSPDTGSWAQYSTFSLYGLAAVGTTPVIAPKALGGNIENDGTYWYHTFLSTGAFVPQTGLTCDALVIAGGGSGGSSSGGGGGAGGVVYAASRSFTATSYTVTVGAGAAAATNASVSGTQGSNSSLDSMSAIGGGFGSAYGTGASGGSGGSGGGGGQALSGGSSTQTSGTGFTGYGYAGGTGGGSAGAGGGGAGAVGTTSSGGAGLNTWSSWASATSTGVSGYYAGGGGGGSYPSGNIPGGAGGGGTGGSYASGGVGGTAGTINTGSGGGGTANAQVGQAGGSGIVIIRYPIA